MASGANIIRPFPAETILQFVTRQGAATTAEVAHRFGLDMPAARRALKVLERDKHVTASRGDFAYARSMLTWRARP